MTLLSAADIAAFQSAFDRFRVELARPIAAAKQTTLCDIYRSAAPIGGKTSAAVLYLAAVPCHIAAPAGAAALQALADLGGARAGFFGELPWDVDVREGDQLRVGDVVYLVERAADFADMTLCAVSEVRR